jgi:hypothetical protein
MALAAACLRNYVHVRVMTLNDVITEKNDGVHDDPTVLFIPNFATVAKDHAVSQWDASLVYDLLLHRYTRSLQTVLSCRSKYTIAEKQYGLQTVKHLESYYTKV